MKKNNDVGDLVHKGSVLYNPDTQNYRVTGSGANMWFGEDEFHIVWKKMKGDFILRTGITFEGKGVDPHRKAGWIIRNTMDKNSPHVNASLHGDGLTSLQFRRTPGGDTEQEESELNGPNVMTKQGPSYFHGWSPDGKKIVILSFPAGIDSADHPFYKRVYLRLLPLDGGKPKVIGYVYGGQGTINVPSWSPDSTITAFVSNSVIE